MSGHSKWSQIKRQKGVADQKRGKVFSKLANLITIAARESGADPAMNPRLRIAIEQARAENMPKENIDRAIKRGVNPSEGVQIEETRYEAYGPGGIGILIEVATDNRNRANSDVRSTLNRLGGKLASTGAVVYQFVQRGVLTIPIQNQSLDQEVLELAIIEAGPENYETQEDTILVNADLKDLSVLRERLEQQKILITESKLSWEPVQTISVTDPNLARQILRLMEALDDLDDVTSVTANFDIPDEMINS